MADDLTRPFIGYRSAGRRPETQQDRRASADAPLAALRGMVSGVLGAPGDIESLVRMLPGLSEQTVLPTSEDVRGRLPGRSLESTPVGRAATELGTLGGGFYTGPGSPLRAMAALPSAVRRAGTDFAMAAGQPAVNVVKPKGGNWLAGSVEKAIDPLKARDRFGMTDPRDLAAAIGVPLEEAQALHASNLPNVAINRWLDQKLAKYIKNEMATPEDPLRALAERGVLHYEPQGGAVRAHSNRTVAEMPTDPTATSPLARAWEDISDAAVLSGSYAEHTPLGGFSEEALRKLGGEYAVKNPQATAYKMDSGITASDLGFGHLVDELKNAINPASGLPENLRWKYSDLDKVTVPQAVERVAKINEWRAAHKAEADLARSMNPATQVVKEYPEQGFKWVELRQPKETGRKITVEKSEMDLPPDMDQRQMLDAAMDMAADEGLDEGTQAFDDFVRNLMTDFNRKKKVDMDESYKALEDALKYEGETMGHCVGGYCPDVASGQSRIYSLRDKKGQPHVTIEVRPSTQSAMSPSEFYQQKDAPESMLRKINEAEAAGYLDDIGSLDDFVRASPEYNEYLNSLPQEIVQIKGKANRAPKEEYLPAVQDFIRSGKWANVGDAQNAGLRHYNSVFNDEELHILGDYNVKMPEHGYLTGEEIQQLHNLITPEGMRLKYDAKGNIIGGDESSGFATGGLVSGANFPTGDFDPARIDSIVDQLHAMNAG